MAQPVPPPNAKIVFKLPKDGDQKKATNAMAPSVLPGARPTAAKQLSRMAAVYPTLYVPPGVIHPTLYVPPGVIQAQQKPEKKWIRFNGRLCRLH
ncbi:hypothetical protein GCK72_002880 [Caenorhabditis remanei]|uniref:Uncharacterized protein n=1 Tax=Caenorhabditis remanei TaxID=31234 RepID=A0A6A5HTZ8_CAERE|nr:hypothetical protein GCK72_002880 [Caenorhabditis remanei]KAF1771055.1 hypothetical protein GCK72_002880 [Caenorhabditis remanei]